MTPTDTVAGVVSSLSNLSDADLVGSLLGGPASVTEPEAAPAAVPAPVVPEPGTEADLTPGTEPEAEPELEAEPEVVEGGEPEAAAAPVLPALEREPITPFEVQLPDGTKIPLPDLRIAYKGNGKDRVDNLDKLVRLAQSGTYNEELVRRADEATAKLPEMEQRIVEREEMLALRERQIEQLLSDDEYLAQAREAFDSYSAPEARASRAETEVKQVRQKEAEAIRQQNLYGFVTSTVMPTIEGMIAQYPTVSLEEVWGRFALNTGPMQVKGEIPPARWRDVVGMLKDDIGPWMAQLHEHRNTAAATQKALAETQKAQSDQAVLKAQETAAKAKRTLAKTVRPTGSAGSGGKNPKPIVNAQDGLDSILSELGLSGP